MFEDGLLSVDEEHSFRIFSRRVGEAAVFETTAAEDALIFAKLATLEVASDSAVLWIAGPRNPVGNRRLQHQPS